jgi:hypothetical protein
LSCFALLVFHSLFNRLIFGLDNGLVVIDYLSKFILMNMATGDLYGTMDPFQRTIVSPKRRGTTNDSNNDDSGASDHQVNICLFIFLFRFIETKQKETNKFSIYIYSI